jgi:hypothetical protein
MYAAKERSLAVGLNFEFLALSFVIGWLNFDETLVRWKLCPQSRALLALKTY